MAATEDTGRVAAMAATRVQVGMEADTRVGLGDMGPAGAEVEELGTKAGLDTRIAGTGEVTGVDKTTVIRPSVATTTRQIATRSARVTSSFLHLLLFSLICLRK